MANFNEKSRKNTKNNDGFLMNLPSHIILEILTRLPAKSIIYCKCVCKTWLELISDPSFSALHFARARPGLVIHQSEMFKNFLRLVDFKDDVDSHGFEYETMVTFEFSNLSTFHDANIAVDGSINGFLFLRDVNYKHEMLYICNPLTREYITLPTPRGIIRYPSVVTHGFGISLISRGYKVVRIFHERVLDPRNNSSCLSVPYSECQVYTLGTGEWRCVGEVPFVYSSKTIGFFHEGNLHWLIQDLGGNELISCFDLENEVFKPFPPPFPGRKIQGSLGELRGCLCLCDNSSEFDIEIWVMKEYGVGETWSKDIVIRKIPQLIGPSFVTVHALKVFRDGNVLILWGDFFMLCYCSKSDVATEVDMDQPRGPNSIEAMAYVPSFLSLRSFKMETVSMF